MIKYKFKQECIPVGCVPPAAMAVYPATHIPLPCSPPAIHAPLPRMSSAMHALLAMHAPSAMHAPCHACPP